MQAESSISSTTGTYFGRNVRDHRYRRSSYHYDAGPGHTNSLNASYQLPSSFGFMSARPNAVGEDCLISAWSHRFFDSFDSLLLLRPVTSSHACIIGPIIICFSPFACKLSQFSIYYFIHVNCAKDQETLQAREER